MSAKTLRAIILIPSRSEPRTTANHSKMPDQDRGARPATSSGPRLTDRTPTAGIVKSEALEGDHDR